MDSLISLYSNKVHNYFQKIPIGSYFLLFVLLYWAALCVSQEDALDLGRYYASLMNKTQTSSIEEIINMRMFGTNKYDFVYHIILFVSIKLSIPLNFVTASIVFIYFYLICYIMRRFSCKKIDYYVFFVALFTTPITWTIAISRSLTSIMFLTIAFVFILKNKKIIGALFLILTVFTHFSSVLYIIVFAASWFLANRKINKPLIFLLLILALGLSFAIPSSIREFMNMLLVEDSGYTHYFLDSGYFFFLANSIHYGDKLPVLFALFYSVFLLFLNKNQGYAFWLLFLTTILLFFFLNFGVMFVNRLMLIMPLCWGLNISLIYRYSTSQSISFVGSVSLVGLIPILLHLYAYRETYFLI